MKLQAPTMVEGTWAKRGVDLFNNGIVTILNEGIVRENTMYPDEKTGLPKTELVFKIKTKAGEERIISFGYNPKTGYQHQTLKSLGYSFGEDTSNWVGREVRTFFLPTPAGKVSVLLTHKDAEKIENPDGTISFTQIQDNTRASYVTTTAPLPTEDTRDFTHKNPDDEMVDIKWDN